MAGLVGRFEMHEDKGVAGGEPLFDPLDSSAQIGRGVVGLALLDRLEPDPARKTARAGTRIRRRTPRSPMSLLEGRDWVSAGPTT